jgi:hypothetical protein
MPKHCTGCGIEGSSMKKNHAGIGGLLWATAAICLWLVAANAVGLQAAEPFIEADVPLFANRGQHFYRLPSLLVTSRGTVLAATLTAAEQEVLASRLLAELAGEDDFDWAIAATSDKLAILARQALAEHAAGLTEELAPDRL